MMAFEYHRGHHLARQRHIHQLAVLRVANISSLPMCLRLILNDASEDLIHLYLLSRVLRSNSDGHADARVCAVSQYCHFGFFSNI